MSAVTPDAASKVAPVRVARRSRRRAEAQAARHRRSRAVASLILLLISISTAILTLAQVHGPARFAFGITVGLLTPGWSIIGFLSLDNAPLEFSLSVGTSLAVLMVAAQILITINEWHLGGLEVVTCLVCAVPLYVLTRRFARPPRAE